MRFIYVLATILVLAALLVTLVSAEVPKRGYGVPMTWRLVTVSHTGWDQLQELASWGVQIINYRGDVLAALSYDEQIESLRQAGFDVRVLDPAADPDLYYLAYSPQDGDDVSFAAASSGLEAVYPYADGVYIVRAQRTAAEALAARGVQIVKLPRLIKLDRGESVSAGPRGQLAHSSDIQEMVDAVSSALLIQDVCKLQDDDSQVYCNELGTRYSYDTAGMNEAAQYLYEQYAALNMTVTYDPFSYAGYSMNNVVAELPGSGPDSDHIYILCAHYDSRANSGSVAPGADDNASGSAAVLEAARILSQYRFNRTIRFVHFAGEEQGMKGSAHYAAAAAQRGDLIDGVINLDMIGYEKVPPNDHIVEVHAGINPASIALADALISNIAEYGLLLVPQKITSDATDRSDHSSFWSRGYPAILGIQDFQDLNPYYHSANDTLANMQTHMMVEYTKACIATLAELARDVRSPSKPIYLPSLAAQP